MSGRRLAGTAAAMTGIAVALQALTPPLAEMAGMLLDGQRTADALGGDALVTAAAGLLAWAVWAWGALGLLLTAASAVPGALGRAARLLTRVVLPAGARRGAAVALGVGLSVAAPLGGTATLLVVTAPAAVADTPPALVPDWPTAPPDAAEAPAEGPAATGSSPAPASAAPSPTAPSASPTTAAPDERPTVPDWPDAPPAPAPGEHVVVRGDCLWDVAAARLATDLGRAPGTGEVADAVHAWWTANADVIGPDPDLLLPGQVLRPPP